MPGLLPGRPCRSTVANTCIDGHSNLNDVYHPPVKRSMTVAGHQTSISLEPLFWDRLRAAAEADGLPVNALVAQIDVARLESQTPCGLASAIRLWLMARE